MLYKKVDKESPEAVTAGLDLFVVPPTNCAIAQSQYREYLTLNPITSPPFSFKIHPIQVKMHFLLKIIKIMYRATLT